MKGPHGKSIGKTAFALFLFLSQNFAAASKPRTYKPGDSVSLKVQPLKSTKTQVDIPYSSLPLCQGPNSVQQRATWSLPESLRPSEESPYNLKMEQEIYCQQLCVANIDNDKIATLIQQRYNNHYTVDDLNVASKIEDDATITTRYWQGVPLGFVWEDTGNAYIHNHINIEIMYHPVGNGESESYRVVRFAVEPFSILHEFELLDDESARNEGGLIGTILNPIASCNTGVPLTERTHTSYDMVTDIGREPQPAHGQVLFTYDVTWILNSDLEWPHRWDVYVSMDNAIPDQVHLLSYFNSVINLIIIFGVISVIHICRVKMAAKLTPVGEDDDDDVDEELQKEIEARARGPCCDSHRQKWRAVSGDVFRPPKNPLLLACCCGTGSHLLATCSMALSLGLFGVWHPSHQRSMVIDLIFVYVALSGVGGFVTAQKCQDLGNKDKQMVAAATTAVAFPGVLFAFITSLFLWGRKLESTWGVDNSSILALLAIWLLVVVPLTLLGGWFGSRRVVPNFPVEISDTIREIPKRCCCCRCLCPFFSFLANAFIPFGAVFVEFYFVLAAVWMGYWSPPFKFVGIGFLLTVISCALMNMQSTYWQLCRENHRWWWCSFRNGASTALFIWLYSFVYFQQMEPEGDFVYYLYIGSMTLFSLGVAMILGYVSVECCTRFNRVLYSTIVHTH